MTGLTRDQLLRALAVADDGGGEMFDLVPAKGERPAVETELFLNFVIARHEDAAGLPVARLEILEHPLELGARLRRGHIEDFADQPFGAARCRSVRLPADLERTHHDARRIGMQPQRMIIKLGHSRPGTRLETHSRETMLRDGAVGSCHGSGFV